MRKVLVIAYYFPPLGWSGVQRTLKFAKYLRDFDWEPIVVTVGKTKFSILDQSLENELPKDINIIRIDDIVLKDVTDAMKRQLKGYIEASMNFISDENLKQLYEEEIEKIFSELRDLLLIPDGNAIWANSVIKKIRNKIDFNKIDVVYTTSGPYSAHIIGEYIKRKYSIPWIADFRDQWINNPYIDYDKNSLRYKIEKSMEKSVVLNCDRLITTTPIITENYISTYKIEKNKVITITNGYDEEDFKNIKSKKQNKENKKMLEKIKEITAESLGADAGTITEETSFKEDLGADSLDLFEMVMAFEEAFEVEIPSEDLEQIQTVGDVVKYLEAHK